MVNRLNGSWSYIQPQEVIWKCLCTQLPFKSWVSPSDSDNHYEIQLWNIFRSSLASHPMLPRISKYPQTKPGGSETWSLKTWLQTRKSCYSSDLDPTNRWSPTDIFKCLKCKILRDIAEDILTNLTVYC